MGKKEIEKKKKKCESKVKLDFGVDWLYFCFFFTFQHFLVYCNDREHVHDTIFCLKRLQFLVLILALSTLSWKVLKIILKLAFFNLSFLKFWLLNSIQAFLIYRTYFSNFWKIIPGDTPSIFLGLKSIQKTLMCSKKTTQLIIFFFFFGCKRNPIDANKLQNSFKKHSLPFNITNNCLKFSSPMVFFFRWQNYETYDRIFAIEPLWTLTLQLFHQPHHLQSSKDLKEVNHKIQ